MSERTRTELAGLRAELERAGAGAGGKECPADWARLTVPELKDAEALMAKQLAGEELSPEEAARINLLHSKASYAGGPEGQS